MTSVIVRYRAGIPEDEDTLNLVNQIANKVGVDVLLVKESADVLQTAEVKIGPYTLTASIDALDLEVAVRAALDRDRQLVRLPQTGYSKRVRRGSEMSLGDRVYLWIADHYLAIINLFLAVYLGLAFLAPVLERSGAVLPAQFIYRAYGNLCHQLAYRSWFLFGEQAYYPRELAHLEGLVSYETATGLSATDVDTARAFVGDKQLGFKVALCQRDIAMYGAFFVFSLLFGLTRRRIRQFPFWWFVIIGLLPIGLDGFSQIPSLAENMPAWLPIRESNPLLRIVTGILFGFTLAWFFIPMLHESVIETRQVLITKLEIIKQRSQSSHANDH